MSVSGTARSVVEFVRSVGSVPTPRAAVLSFTTALRLGFKGDAGYASNLDDIDETFERVYTLAASTPLDLDLRSLTEADGRAVSFAKVRYLKWSFRSTNDAHSVAVAPQGANGWTSLIGSGGSLTLRASTARNPAWFEFTCPNATGYATGAGNKDLRFDPGSGTGELAIFLAGVKV